MPSAPQADPLAVAEVAVDGSGMLPEDIALQLRRLGVGRVRSGAYAADAAEAAGWASSEVGAARALVLVGDVVPDAMVTAPWHRAGVVQLPVTCSLGQVAVGPLVLPGRTSCTHCHALLRSDLTAAPAPTRAQSSADARDRVPSGIDPEVRVLAAAVAAVVVASALGGDDRMGGISVDIGADGPDLRHRFWPRHPACGCADPIRRGAPMRGAGGAAYTIAT